MAACGQTQSLFTYHTNNVPIHDQTEAHANWSMFVIAMTSTNWRAVQFDRSSELCW